ncbi:class A beta-lactamase-related serine hydrolase [Seongchinamella sediminis]|uniref:Class A beta-lactamase-related serine hydrolase n=1 Tax=Seongchinamella sediminis TaxID=2283635 RepID=A0A3L7E4K9_9GAMM|nr:serine hydrolase domain-containing protein [Seongchinamella sediminis]RLQ23412.1 class A beta-lactamase-related serine hydrolase [Seongchinamella sediminis]
MKKTVIALSTTLITAVALAQAPHIEPAGDHRHLGEPDNILFWSPRQKVAGFRNPQLLFPLRRVASGKRMLALDRHPVALDAVTFRHQGQSLTIDDYFQQFHTAALLVLHQGAIVYERYALGNTRHSVWNGFSVTKSITSMLVGTAIADGHIASVDEAVTSYLPQLRGSAYDGVSIRHILQMTSGVGWNEDYADPESDINRIDWRREQFYRYLQASERVAPPGKQFNYSTAETQLAGDLVRAATGMDLATYLGDSIWRPFGMEADGWWQLTAADAGEFGGSSLHATLRDFGRLGLFALAGGRLASGEQMLAPGWMADSVTPSLANPRYGYQWWLGSDGAFEASGIFGQSIYIDPEHHVVIAQHSAREQASDKRDWAAQAAAFRAIVAAVAATE